MARNFEQWMRQMEREVREAKRSGVPIAIKYAQDAYDKANEELQQYKDLVPAAPIELTYQTALYTDRDGAVRGRLTIDFPDVVFSTNQTPIQVTDYELHGRAEGYGNVHSAYPGHLLPGQSYPGTPGSVLFSKAKLRPMQRVATSNISSFTVDGITQGQTLRYRVRASGGTFVQPGLWSQELVIYVEKDTTPPPQPTAPRVRVSRGVIMVDCDGQAVNGPMPADLDRIVLAHGTSSSPTGEVYEFSRSGGTYVLPGAGYFDTQFFRLQAVDQSGNRGNWSEQATGMALPLVDEDVILSRIDAAETIIDNAGALILESGETLTGLLDQSRTDLADTQTRLSETQEKLNYTFPATVNLQFEEAKAAAAADAQAKADAAKQAAITAAALDATAKAEQAEADAALDASAKANQALADAKLDASNKATAAEQAAINAAALDATSKAEQAEADAVAAAAITAQQKADAAKQQAIAAAETHANLVASGAEQAAIDAAAIDAQGKADAAQQAAIDAAALDATAKAEAAEAAAATDAAAKANQALADAMADSTVKADEAERLAKEAAALDATAKAEQAEADAVAAAALDATAKANQAKADAQAAAEEYARQQDEPIRLAAEDAQLAADAAQLEADRLWDSVSKTYTNPCTDASRWTLKQGPAITEVSSPGAMGGFALEKRGYGSAWWIDNTGMQPFDPELIYRITAKMRVTDEASKIEYDWAGTAGLSESTYKVDGAITRRNLISNPSFEVNITGWSGSASVISHDTTYGSHGTKSLKMTNTVDGNRSASITFPVTAGLVYALSSYMKHNALVNRNLRVDYAFETDAGARVGAYTAGSSFLAGPNSQIRPWVITTAVPATATRIRLYVVGLSMLTSESMWADGVLAEQVNTIGQFFDGSFTDDLVKSAYIGLNGYLADQTTHCNVTGANSYSSQHYVVAGRIMNAAEGWVTLEGYIRGYGATVGAGGTYENPTGTTGKMHPNVKYVAPMVLMDYNNGDGAWELSHITVDAVPPEALDKAKVAQDRADEAHTLAGTAESNAQTALTMAGGKSRVYYSANAPSGTGKTDDTWRQTNGTGDVIAEWRWTGAWTSQKITSEAISNLDVGKLTVGTGVISQLVAQHIAAESGEFIELDVSQLRSTTATIDTAVIDKLWTDVVMSRKIGAQHVVVGEGGNLIPNGAGEKGDKTGFANGTSMTLDTVDKPAGVMGSFRSTPGSGTVTGNTEGAFSVEPGAEYVAEIWLKADKPNSRIYIELRNGAGLVGPNAVVPGSAFPSAHSGNYLVGNHVVPTVWTKYETLVTMPAATDKVRVSNIFFNHPDGTERTATQWFAIRLKARVSGTLIVEDTIYTRHLNVTEDMTVALLAAHKVQAGEIEVNTLFADATFTGSLNTHVATFLTNEDGTGHTSTVTGQGLRVTYTDPTTGEVMDRVRLGTFSEDDYFALTDDFNETAVSFDKTGNGALRALDVRDEIYYKGTSLTDILNSLPKLVTWGQIQINDNMSTITEVGLFEVGWETANDDPVRMYEFNVNPFLINQTQAGIVGLRLRYTTDGSAPTVNSPIIGYSYFHSAGTGLATTGQFTRIISSSNGPYIRVLLCLYDNTSGITSVYGPATGQTHLYFTVKDLGIEMPRTGSATTGGGTPYTGSTVAAPTNPTVTKTSEWGYNGVRSYLPSGATYAYNTSKAYQGQSPAGYGNLNSMYTFPSLTSTLSGATIHDIWVYLYFEHWYYNSGGTAEIRLHDNLTVPGSYAGMTTNGVNSTSWPKASGRWVRLPSSLYDGFKTGAYRGFGLTGDGLISYGIANNARIKIKYTK